MRKLSFRKGYDVSNLITEEAANIINTNSSHHGAKVGLVLFMRDLMAILFIMFQAFVIPFEIGFSYDPDNGTRNKYNWITIFYIVVDAYFFRCFVYRWKKAEISKKKIFEVLKDSSSESSMQNKMALTSWCGYGEVTLLLFEVIAFLPFDAFDFFWGNEIFFIRTLKLLRLGLINKYSDKIVRYLGQRNYQFKSNIMRLIRDVFVLIYTSHTFGCVFMCIAHFECGITLDSTRCVASWAISDNLSNASVIHQYARALYWGTINVVPLGLGDITPRTNAETILTTILYICGSMNQNQLIANFSFVFSTSEKLRMHFDRVVDNVKQFMTNRKIPPYLQTRVKSYFEYEWGNLKGLDENEVTESLPPHLKRAVLKHLQSSSVGQIPFWRGRSEAFLSSLSSFLKQKSYSPGDTIVNEGNNGRMLYIIKNGQADKFDKKGKKIGVLDEGNFFGEMSLFEDSRTLEFTVKARTFTELYCLDIFSFDKMLLSFYGDDAAEHRELMGEKAAAANKSAGKTKKVLGNDDEELEALHSKTNKNRWKLPSSSFRRIWDLIGGFCMMYFAIETPMRLCFLLSDWQSFYSNPLTCTDSYVVVTFVLDMSLSLFLVVDWILNCGVFYFESVSHTGLKIVIQNPEQILSNYKLSKLIYIDLISTIPFTLLCFAFNNQGMQALSFLRFFRLFNITKYWNNAVEFFDEFFGVVVATAFLRMSALIMQISWNLHFVGCIFYIIGYLEIMSFSDNAPLNNQNNITTPFYHISLSDCEQDSQCTWLLYDGIQDQSTIKKYLRSFYWSVNVFTTVGYGDVKPITTIETFAAILWTVCSAIYFYYSCGLISAFAEALNASVNNNQEKIDNINAYMEMSKLPEELRYQIRDFYKYLWEVQQGVDEKVILSFLPSSLHEEITSYLYERSITSIYLFDGMQPDFIKIIISKLEQYIYLKGDFLVRDGDMSNHLFIINMGRMEVTASDKVTVLAALCEGNFFGDTSFFNQIRQKVYIKAESLCNVSQLSKKDFVEVADKFPGLLENIKGRAEERGRKENRLSEMLAKNLSRPKVKQTIDPKDGLYVKQVRSPYFVFTPTSLFRRVWDLLLLILIYGTFLLTPFRLAFFHTTESESYITTLIVLDVLVDILFLIDIYLKLTKFGFNEDGELIADPSRIFKKYSTNGWMKLDLISSIPMYSTNGWILSLVRLPRVFKVVQITEYFDGLQDFLLTLYSKFNSKWLRLVKLFLFAMSVGHYFGCFYYLLSLLVVNGGDNVAWIIRDNDYGDDVSIVRKYFRSLYWALESLTLGCHGDIISQNTLEDVWAIFCALSGFVVVSTVIGNISDILLALDKAGAETQRKIDTFLQYASKQDLPHDLRSKVLTYYDFQKEYTKGIDAESISRLLPPSLRTQATGFVYGPILKNIYIFKNLSSGMINEISTMLKLHFYTPGDTVMFQGDIGGELLILQHGVAEVLSAVDECVYAVIGEGSVCGEISFFLPNTRRIANVRAAAYCEFLSFSKSDWESISEGMDDMKAIIVETINQQQAMYKKIHLNIRKNLYISIKRTESKLHRIIVQEHERRNRDVTKKSLCSRMRAFLSCSTANKDEDENDDTRSRGDSLDGSITSVIGPQTSIIIEMPEKDREEKRPSILKSTSPLQASARSKDRRASLGRRDERRRSDAMKLEQEIKDKESLMASEKNDENSIAKDDKKEDKNDGPQENLNLTIPKTPILHSNDYDLQKRLQADKSKERRTSQMISSRKISLQSTSPKNSIFKNVGKFDEGEKEREKETLGRPIAKNPPKSISNLSFVRIENPKTQFGLPDSVFRRWWDFTVLCFITYYALISAFRLGFMANHDVIWEPYTKAIYIWFELERATDIFFLLNIILNWNYFAIIRNGTIVTDAKILSEKYIRSYFIIDVLTLIPLDYLMPVYGLSMRDYRSFSILRLNKLLWIYRLSESFKKVCDYISNSSNLIIRPSTLSLFRTVCYFLLFGHWVACLWYYIGLAYGGFGSYNVGDLGNTLSGDGGWMSYEGALMNSLETISDVTVTRRYLRSIYFSLGTMITVASGDIKVITLAETMLTILLIILACAALSSVIGVHRGAIGNVYSASAQFEENLLLTMWYLKNRKFDYELRDKIYSYYLFLWNKKKGLDASELLDDLPTSLRTEIALFVNCEVIEKVDLFEHCEQAFVDALVLVLKTQLLMPQDFVIKQGEIGNEMYFVESGILSVFDDAKTFSAKKKYGEYFGEVALLLDLPRNANVQADTECEILALHRNDYELILSHYPEYRERNRAKWIKPWHMPKGKLLRSDSQMLDNFRKSKSQRNMTALIAQVKEEENNAAVVNETTNNNNNTNNNKNNSIDQNIIIKNKEAIAEDDEEEKVVEVKEIKRKRTSSLYVPIEEEKKIEMTTIEVVIQDKIENSNPSKDI